MQIFSFSLFKKRIMMYNNLKLLQKHEQIIKTLFEVSATKRNNLINVKT